MLGFLLSISDESNHDRIEYIYATYSNDMLRYAKYKLKNRGVSNYELDAEDVVQNSFLRIIRYIDRISRKASGKELRTYLFSIVSREVDKLLKDQVLFDSFDVYSDVIEDGDFWETLRIEKRYDDVVKKIKKMDDRYSMTLLFYYCNEMSVKEIATMMGLSDKTVYTRLSRGMRLLKDSFKSEEKKCTV